MIDFKKLSAFAVVGLVYFLIFAGITYASVQNYDGKEALQNLGQSVLASLATILANMANSLFKIVLAAATMLAGAGECEAGPLFGRFFNRSRCANGQCTPAPRSTPQAKPAQRYECRNGVCRPVQAK